MRQEVLMNDFKHTKIACWDMKMPPLMNECEVTGKRETYGINLKLLGIDKASEMLEEPE